MAFFCFFDIFKFENFADFRKNSAKIEFQQNPNGTIFSVIFYKTLIMCVLYILSVRILLCI